MKLLVINFLLTISGMTIITALLVLLFSTSAVGEIRIVPTLSGEKVFKQKCKSCHTLDKKRHGPPLGSILGKEVGSTKGYKYSKAMKKSDIVWNEVTLDKFLKSPKKYLKGTKMRIKGLKRNQRDAIIEYLRKNQK